MYAPHAELHLVYVLIDFWHLSYFDFGVQHSNPGRLYVYWERYLSSNGVICPSIEQIIFPDVILFESMEARPNTSAMDKHIIGTHRSILAIHENIESDI